MGRVYGMCWFGVVMVMESWVSKEIRALQAPWVGEGAVGAHHELLAHVGMVGMGWEAAHPDPSFLRSCGALGEPHQIFLVVGSLCGVLLGWLSEGDVGCFVAVFWLFWWLLPTPPALVEHGRARRWLTWCGVPRGREFVSKENKD